MHRSSAFLVAIVIASIMFPSALAAVPLSPGFTYQGLYEEGGIPVEGSFHPRFSLWDAETEGSQVGLSQTVIDTPLIDGVFTVILNASGEFGPNAFNGEARWLQIEICSDDVCSATTVLGPRQPITGAPYALGPWNRSAQGDLNYASGNVAIGTVTPEGALHVAAPGDVVFSGGAVGVTGVSTPFTSGKGVFLEGGNSPWANVFAFDYDAFTPLSLALNAPGGNVGIGTSQPNHRLRISGGSPWTSSGWTGSLELDNVTAIGWRSNISDSCFGIGQSNGGLYFFRTTSNPGVSTQPARYDMLISDSGNVGVGTIGPSAQIHAVASGKPAIRGVSNVSFGVHGQSQSSHGVVGQSDTNHAVVGQSTSAVGVIGENSGGSVGVLGRSPFVGVQGNTVGTANDRQAVRGENGGSTMGYAGLFTGNAWVTGTLTKGGGAFKIDHPLEPETKFLSHSFVESPDMMNIYNGNVTTDAEGYAEIPLPEWFEALNRDFRYQLTVLDEEDSDAFTQAKVVKKIASNRFTIRTSRPQTEVSWQVTGVRQDAWANANRIQVEEEKTPEEKGKFLHPQSLGIGKVDGSDYASVALPILVPISAK